MFISWKCGIRGFLQNLKILNRSREPMSRSWMIFAKSEDFLWICIEKFTKYWLLEMRKFQNLTRKTAKNLKKMKISKICFLQIFFSSILSITWPRIRLCRRAAKKCSSQNFGNKVLGKVKKFGHPIISRLKVHNRFVRPRVLLTPPPSLGRVKWLSWLNETFTG